MHADRCPGWCRSPPELGPIRELGTRAGHHVEIPQPQDLTWTDAARLVAPALQGLRHDAIVSAD